jgi:hypothetical protein
LGKLFFNFSREQFKGNDKLEAWLEKIPTQESVINKKVNDGANEKTALAVLTIPKGQHGNSMVSLYKLFLVNFW